MSRSTFNDVVFSPLMRTNEVKRYSGTRLQEEESLSQHITDMCMMSYIISKRLISYGDNIDLGLVLEKCLIHDLDELATGDLPRNTKYANECIKKEMDNVAMIAIQKFMKYHEGLDDLLDKWDTAKQGKEGFIIKLADMLCVVRKAIMEVEIYNNLSCLKVTNELQTHLTKLGEKLIHEKVFDSDESVNFINEIILCAMEVITDINSRYSYICNKYNITKNILEV